MNDDTRTTLIRAGGLIFWRHAALSGVMPEAAATLREVWRARANDHGDGGRRAAPVPPTPLPPTAPSFPTISSRGPSVGSHLWIG